MQQTFTRILAVALSLSMVVLSSCDIPYDPEGSWEKAQKEGLVVGRVLRADSSQFPRERALVEQFAQENGLQLHWEQGSETDMVDQLKEYKLQLVVGGFEQSTIWIEGAATSASWDDKHVLLLPKGENRLATQVDDFIRKQQGGQP